MTKLVVLAVAMQAVAPPTLAAEFSMQYQMLDDGSSFPDRIVLTGKIEPGDNEKFLKLLRQNPIHSMQAAKLELNSPGGDVAEALKIASVVNEAAYGVTVPKLCGSACFFIYVTGWFRYVDEKGRLGVHRPFMDQSTFAGYSASEAKAKMQAGSNVVKAFLDEHSVPKVIQEVMFNAASNEVVWLSNAQIDLIGSAPAHIEELELARCGDPNAALKEIDPEDPEAAEKMSWLLSNFPKCLRTVYMPDRIAFIDKLAPRSKEWDAFMAKWKESNKAAAKPSAK